MWARFRILGGHLFSRGPRDRSFYFRAPRAISWISWVPARDPQNDHPNVVWQLPGVPPGGTPKMLPNCRPGRRGFFAPGLDVETTQLWSSLGCSRARLGWDVSPAQFQGSLERVPLEHALGIPAGPNWGPLSGHPAGTSNVIVVSGGPPGRSFLRCFGRGRLWGRFWRPI